ncbi:hypothetical protein COLO4_28927 [Corchorus olitorius]|uniref:Uncharacterized protein n=1 Tax=Corchorus olitorius TaxID=93759 RepID=A0A1R3HHL0_9ROSI|nr:hypothetical protein COLO4_28927 [Corchorus olitorius]
MCTCGNVSGNSAIDFPCLKDQGKAYEKKGLAFEAKALDP